MIDPPRVPSEEPTAVTPHGGICGAESQQWLSYPTQVGICGGGAGDRRLDPTRNGGRRQIAIPGRSEFAFPCKIVLKLADRNRQIGALMIPGSFTSDGGARGNAKPRQDTTYFN
jgi:hypothetical protein